MCWKNGSMGVWVSMQTGANTPVHTRVGVWVCGQFLFLLKRVRGQSWTWTCNSSTYPERKSRMVTSQPNLQPPLLILFLRTCGCESATLSQRALFFFAAVFSKSPTVLEVLSKSSTVSVIIPSPPLLCYRNWPQDLLSSLESIPVSIEVPKQVDCDMIV